jgi:hypothetical protein
LSFYDKFKDFVGYDGFKISLRMNLRANRVQINMEKEQIPLPRGTKINTYHNKMYKPIFVYKIV